MASSSQSSHPRKRWKKGLRGGEMNRTKDNSARRMRDIQRKLQHSKDLPSDIRLGLERELQALDHQNMAKKAEENKKVMMRRYKMIRFVERQKATRRLNRLRRELESAPADNTERVRLERAVHVAQIDLNYTLYHPFHRAYCSIYPRQSEQLDEDRERKGDPETWDLVEKAMAEGWLEELRDEVTAKPRPKSIPRERVKPGKDDVDRTNEGEGEGEGGGDGSGGDFFE